MSDFIKLVVFCVVLLSLDFCHLVFCKKKSWGNKSLKKLTKSEVDVKTYLFPCSYDKDILNSSFGSNHQHIRNCKRKFVIRMTVNSGGEYCSKTDGFIPIDHVIDGISGRKKRLLNPFMVRLKREKMYQLYDLQLVKSVNAEAKEEVINYENTPNYTGCDTSSSHPTCGFSFFNNKIVQFSEGFCCSCNENKNEQRQPCESHLHESKDFQDMEYAVNQHRSNRTSRDIEIAQNNMEKLVLGSRSVKSPTDDLHTAFRKLNPAVAESSEELDIGRESIDVENNDFEKSQNRHNTFSGENRVPVDTCDVFKPDLNSDFWNNNVTIKSFEFEHSIDKNIGHSYSVSPLNILIDTAGEKLNKEEKEVKINNTNLNDKFVLPSPVKLDDSTFNYLTDMEGDLNEYFDNFKHSERANNPIDREKFKLLLMKKIKENKNHEAILEDHDLYLDDTINITNKNPRDLKINESDFLKYNCVKKNTNNGFSLKLENDNSELRLQIITKKPKNITKNKEASYKSPDQNRADKLKNNNFSSSGLQNETFLSELGCFNKSFEYLPINNTTNECKTSSTEWTTKSGMKQHIIPNHVLKYFKSSKNKKNTTGEKLGLFNTSCDKVATNNMENTTEHVKFITTTGASFPPNCSNSLFLSSRNNGTELHNIDVNRCNATTNTTNIESLMCNMVPVINTVQNLKSLDSDGFKKSDGVVEDTDNSTYKVYIQLKKKADKSESEKENTKVMQDFSLFPPPIHGNKGSPPELQKNVIPGNPISSAEYNFQNVENVLSDDPLHTYNPQLKKNHLQSNYVPENKLHNIPAQKIQKREVDSESQIRGGQCCSKKGKTIPCNANPETYFESAHCVRFSDLWYNVFKLMNPRLENSITVKIYARHRTPDKRICWENLTKRLPGRVGTVNEVLTDDSRNIMISYSSDDKVAFNLDCINDYILVPQPLPRYCKDADLKALSYGGPEEYLVLKESEITFDGEECDKAGVNYAAFARQLHRCQQEAGACLKNQPLHYWKRDKKADKDGKQGQYFLKNYMEVSDQSILQNTTSSQVVLRSPYVEKYQSHIVVEMNADHIEIIGDKTAGQITEVYTDATSDKYTIVKAVVTNLGIAAELFTVDFTNCSSRIGPSDFDKPNKDEIPPQHRITYTATISSPLKHKHVECKMILYNVDQELVASRHIIIVEGERCMCVWYCQCVCYNHPKPGLPCNPLTVKDYNRAGFPGHLPVTIGSDCSTFFTVLHALLWFFLFLILFGLLKAILGLCFPAISLWGLWYLLPDEAKSLTAYLEPNLACCPVIRDCDGFPIHPRTYCRSDIHFLPWYSEFVVNVFFFICVFRTCLCDHGSHEGNDCGYYCRDPGCYTKPRGRNNCSPAFSVRRRSPCDSVCSNKRNRKFRVSAGAEEQYLNPDPQLLKDDEWAKRLVNELTQSYVVFRVLTRPMGGVKSVPGTPYCIRGFFLESENGVYEFTPPSPLMQIWQMDGTPLDPPLRLDPRPFHALYRNAREVLAAHELSPWARGVVVNAP